MVLMAHGAEGGIPVQVVVEESRSTCVVSWAVAALFAVADLPCGGTVVRIAPVVEERSKLGLLGW